MKYHYVWLVWSSTFLIPWGILFGVYTGLRPVIWRVSLLTALFGATEPLFVPAYWDPPSLFELAQRTGFDLESFIFAFAIGGIGTVVYDTFTRRRNMIPISSVNRASPYHRFHLGALVLPIVTFVPLFLLPLNPIYPVLFSLTLGALASVLCRPELTRKTLVGGLLFFGLYAAFMLGLKWSAPGYISSVWNIPTLSWGLIYGIPLEELAFGFAFGLYWSSVYEHFTWREASDAEERSRSRHSNHSRSM